jgi:hypothetical protein
MLRAALIATSLATAMPCFAQEVRVITGDIEHVYGSHAQVLDDADLQARNQRALEHMRAEKQLAIERGQASIEAERLKLQEAALADGMAQNWDNWGSTDGDWYDGWFGPTRGFSPRIGFSRRIGIPPRMGISPKMGFSRR